MGKKKTYPEYPLTLGEGLLNAGTGTVDSLDPELTYSLGDMTQLDLFSEHDMRDKYPALKQAWEHYKSVLEVCKTKENEEQQ